MNYSIELNGAHESVNIIVTYCTKHTMLFKYHSNLFTKTYYVLCDIIVCFLLEVSYFIIKT